MSTCEKMFTSAFSFNCLHCLVTLDMHNCSKWYWNHQNQRLLCGSKFCKKWDEEKALQLYQHSAKVKYGNPLVKNPLFLCCGSNEIYCNECYKAITVMALYSCYINPITCEIFCNICQQFY